jgi:hypothetical protein
MMWRFEGFSSMVGLFMLGFKVFNMEKTSWVCMCQRHHSERKQTVPLWSPLTWVACVWPITITLLFIAKTSPNIHNSFLMQSGRLFMFHINRTTHNQISRRKPWKKGCKKHCGKHCESWKQGHQMRKDHT